MIVKSKKTKLEQEITRQMWESMTPKQKNKFTVVSFDEVKKNATGKDDGIKIERITESTRKKNK